MSTPHFSATTKTIRNPPQVIRPPPLTPLLQLVIIATHAREIPPRDASQSPILFLETRVRAAHQALTEVVEAVADVGGIGTIRVWCCLGACCEVVSPAVGVLGLLA